MKLELKTQNTLWVIFAVALVVIGVLWLLSSPAPEHMEDTNGADNYALQQITPQNIIKQNLRARGTVKAVEYQLNFDIFQVSRGKKYSANKFTGVELLYSATVFKGSDIYVSLAEFSITSGNFGFYIVVDGEIAGQVIPGEDATSEFSLRNLEKTAAVEYVIAGESAEFSFVVLNDF